MDFIQEANECQEMALFPPTEIVHRPTRLPGKGLHVHCNRITRRVCDNDVHGFFISESQVGVGTEAMQNGENIKFTGEVCVVSTHDITIGCVWRFWLCRGGRCTLIRGNGW